VSDYPIRPLAAALDGTGRLVAAVRADQWQLPTPCTDWTVRRLLDHLVGGNRLATRVLRGEPLPPLDQLGRRGAEDQLGGDPPAAYRATAAELLEALQGPGVLERTHTSRRARCPAPRWCTCGPSRRWCTAGTSPAPPVGRSRSPTSWPRASSHSAGTC
jgi:uncharacterized protein (TIGR03086 family)